MIKSVCLSFVHSVVIISAEDYYKCNQLISLKLVVMIRPISWKN